MMRMRGSPTTRAVRCRWSVSAASSVISDIDCLPLVVLHLGLAHSTRDCGTSTRGRELELERRAYTKLALDVNLAGVLLHDSVTNGKPETGALMRTILRLGLRCKEGIVNSVEVLLFDAASRVLNADKH